MAKQLRVSHSALDTFNQCNYKYFLKYIERIKPYIPIRYPLVTGVAFHELVNLMYQECDFTRKFLTRNWKPIFEKCLEEEGSAWASTTGSDKYLAYGYVLINQFFKFAEERGYLIKPIQSEWGFTINLEDAVIVGKTDLIIQRSPELPIEILDFKTSWKVPTQEQVDANKQLTLYDWAVKKELGLENTVVGLFLPRKKAILLSSRGPEDHIKLLEELVSFDSSIKGAEFPPNLEHCSTCELKNYCKFYVPEVKK